MSTATITTTTVTPLDHDAAEALGDDILLASARGTKTGKVSGQLTSRRGAEQSGQARAWTSSGDVD